MARKKIKNFKELFHHFLLYFGFDRKSLRRNNYWKILFITFITQFFWLALIYQLLILMLPFMKMFNNIVLSYSIIKLLEIAFKDSIISKIYYVISGRFLYNFNLSFLIKYLTLLFFANILLWYIIPLLIKKSSPIYSKKQ